MAYLTEAEFLDGYLYGDVSSRSDSEDRTAALDAAGAEADGYLRRGGYAVPIAAPSPDLVAAVGNIASWRLRVKLNLAPEPASSSAHYLAYKTAVDWLKAVGEGRVQLPIEDDDLPSVPLPLIEARSSRGW